MLKGYLKIWSLCSLLIMCINNSLKASDTLHAKLKTGCLYAFFGTSFIGLNELWYSSYKTSAFHEFNDSKEWYQMDKLGHFWTCYHITQTGLNMPAQGTFHKTINAVSGLMFLSAVEVLDGYSSGWGFSKSDMLANVLGCAVALTTSKFKTTHPMQFKFGYRASPYANQNPNLLGQHILTRILKDYNGQSYWLSYTPDLGFWPQWLAISSGYGISGFIHAQPNANSCKRYIKFSLDINPKGINCSKSYIKPLKWLLRYVKFPFPAIAFDGKELLLIY